ncbi:hypothetical protein JCM5353_007516 [Sporobolomyces roseus]
MVRMLDQDSSSTSSSTDTPVTLKDQTNINAFSRLNSRTDEILDELVGLKKEQEDLEEVKGELELLEMDTEPDDKIMYKLDSTFVHLPISGALELLETSLGEVSKQVEELEREKGECEEGMDGLKKVLYEKFGNSINLERGD